MKTALRHARINGTVRVLFKTRLIFPRINGPNVSARRIKLEIRKSQDLANDLTLAKKTKCLGPTYK